MTKFQAEFLKQNKNLIFDRFKYKYPDCSEEQFEDYYQQYCNLRPFKASGNIFESGQNISAEVHYLMRLIVQFFFEQAFDAMLIDLNDPNVKEDLEHGNIGTPGRLAKIFCGASITDDTELGSGRWNHKPRIATFPNTDSADIPITKRVDINSSCSHHTIPFGTLYSPESYAIVSYIPKDFVLGISKLQRLVNWVAKRYWLQEDLTKAIWQVVADADKTKDVYVKLCNIRHGCEFLRGAQTKDGSFTSEYYDGKFKDQSLRLQIK